MAKKVKSAWDKERIQALVQRSDIALERAILAIYARQTADEQEIQGTSYKNGAGFSGTDALFGSSLAEQILQNKYGKADGSRLSDKQKAVARKFMGKYWKQLLQIAQSKEQTQNEPVPC
jgi:hypothetical protein